MAREMKDSGVAWIGEIPADWDVLPLKRLCSMQAGKNLISEQIKLSGEYPVYGGNGLRGYFDEFNNDGEYLLVGRQGALCGNVHRVAGRFWATEHAIVTSTSPLAKADFLYYLLTAMDLNQYASDVAAQPGLSVNSILNVKTCSTSFVQQIRIAAFLDKKCVEIDAVLEKTRTSIEEYKKLKQAIITQAVTKGVRGDRPMKESGIGGIDKIPADWSVYKFSHIASVKCNLVPLQEYLDYPQVSPENIEGGSGKLLPCKTVWDSGVISGNHLFFEGQILYSKIRPKLNKVCIAPFSGLCSADMYPIETGNNTKFIVYYMRSDAFLNQVAMITEDRVKMPKINQNELGAILVAIPPEESEQVEIAEYLDQSCAKIDGLISKEERLVLELESYKKSLIYEYVTGKKEVPHVTPFD